MSETMLLEVDTVSVNFGGLAAVKQVSFGVPQGSVVSLIGPNGAGKTTLLNAISGFRRPTSGQVRFDNASITSLAAHRIAHRGLVRTFQKTEVFPDLSVAECVRIGLLNRFSPSLGEALLGSRRLGDFTAKAPAIVTGILDRVGLASKAASAARALSYGEQRLLEVAAGLAAEPRLLLLDEPASGLNADESARLLELILGLQKAGISILLVEHNMEVVMRASDTVVVLHHGEKIAEGTPREISSDRAVISAYLGQDWMADAVG
jgi:branched-chain amino acid transport system ATP-binding protein